MILSLGGEEAKRADDQLLPVGDLRLVEGEGEVILLWNYPDDTRLSHVVVTWYERENYPGGDIAGSIAIEGSVPGAADTTTVDGLENERDYLFTVETVDTNGERTSVSMVEGRPYAPIGSGGMVRDLRAFGRDRGVTLQWYNPGDPRLAFVEVNWSKGGVPVGSFVDRANARVGRMQELSVSNLTNAARYTFELRAATGGSGAQDSTRSIIATPIPVGKSGDAFEEVEVEEREGAIEVLWTPRFSWGIQRIDISWHAVSDGSLVATQAVEDADIASEKNSVVQGGLVPGEHYTMTLAPTAEGGARGESWIRAVQAR